MKPGAAACFSIWGKRDESLQFTIVDRVLKAYREEKGIEHPVPGKSNFNLYDDMGEQLKKDLADVGFKGVKMWEQAHNGFIPDGKTYVETMAIGHLNRFVTAQKLGPAELELSLIHI